MAVNCQAQARFPDEGGCLQQFANVEFGGGNTALETNVLARVGHKRDVRRQVPQPSGKVTISHKIIDKSRKISFVAHLTKILDLIGQLENPALPQRYFKAVHILRAGR